MSKKTIRTMQGKMINFEELALRNEHVKAVGNMNVDAGGNKLESSKVERKKRREQKNFRRQICKKAVDMPVMESKEDAKKFAELYAAVTSDASNIVGIDTITSPEVPIVSDTVEPKKAEIIRSPDFSKVDPVIKQTNEVSDEILQQVINKQTGGLADAIAKAKEVSHEKIKSPREQLRASDGVKKI